jgi:hypothetical protein
VLLRAVVFLFSIACTIACGSVAEPDLRSGKIDNGGSAVNDRDSAEGGAPPDEGVPSGDRRDSGTASGEPSGNCNKTINCNGGVCSCGAGPNNGKACNDESGECDVLCGC